MFQNASSFVKQALDEVHGLAQIFDWSSLFILDTADMREFTLDPAGETYGTMRDETMYGDNFRKMMLGFLSRGMSPYNEIRSSQTAYTILEYWRSNGLHAMYSSHYFKFHFSLSHG